VTTQASSPTRGDDRTSAATANSATASTDAPAGGATPGADARRHLPQPVPGAPRLAWL